MTNREKFKAIRKQRKLSLKVLGEIAGSATSISDFENGHTTLFNSDDITGHDDGLDESYFSITTIARRYF